MKQYRYRQVVSAAVITGITVQQDPQTNEIVAATITCEDCNIEVSPAYIQAVAVAPGFYALLNDDGTLQEVLEPEPFNAIFEELPPTPADLEKAGQLAMTITDPLPRIDAEGRGSLPDDKTVFGIDAGSPVGDNTVVAVGVQKADGTIEVTEVMDASTGLAPGDVVEPHSNS